MESPCWSGTHYMDQTDQKLRANLLPLASPLSGLQVQGCRCEPHVQLFVLFLRAVILLHKSFQSDSETLIIVLYVIAQLTIVFLLIDCDPFFAGQVLKTVSLKT